MKAHTVADQLPDAWHNIDWEDQSEDSFVDKRFVGEVLTDSNFWGDFFVAIEAHNSKMAVRIEYKKGSKFEPVPASEVRGVDMESVMENFWDKYKHFKKFATTGE